MPANPTAEVLNLPLTSIVEDTSIQCRATINMETVNDYAEAMVEGAEFPPLEVYGAKDKAWIGDGWHRYMAAKQNQFREIEVNLHPGDRADALRHALKANSTNGLRRSNADKRRSVEIAVQEFADLSSRAIAELCGVSNHFVDSIRPVQVGTNPTSRKGADGKRYPATRTVKPNYSIQEAAKLLDVPVELIRRAQRIASQSSELAEQVRDGILTIEQAEETIKNNPSPASVVTSKTTKVPTLRSCWMQASKAEREKFLQWVEQDRTKDLPAGDIRDVYMLTAKLRRALRKAPSERRYVARELGFVEPPQVTPCDAIDGRAG